MIYFEIDGEEYRAEINTTAPEMPHEAVHFPGPDGTILWLHRPEKASWLDRKDSTNNPTTTEGTSHD